MERPDIKRIKEGTSIPLAESVKRQLTIRIPASDVMDLVNYIEHLEKFIPKETK